MVAACVNTICASVECYSAQLEVCATLTLTVPTRYLDGRSALLPNCETTQPAQFLPIPAPSWASTSCQPTQRVVRGTSNGGSCSGEPKTACLRGLRVALADDIEGECLPDSSNISTSRQGTHLEPSSVDLHRHFQSANNRRGHCFEPS